MKSTKKTCIAGKILVSIAVFGLALAVSGWHSAAAHPAPAYDVKALASTSDPFPGGSASKAESSSEEAGKSALHLTAAADDAQEDMDRFFKAKELVFKRDWPSARRRLESYLKDFPEGRMRDEAHYWLAHSLNHLAGEGMSRSSIILLKKAAIDEIEKILAAFPESLWNDDAAALRVEIAGELVLLGEGSYQRYIAEAIKARNKNPRDLKIQALVSLVNLDPDTALSIIRRTLESDPDVKVRDRCLSLVVRFPAQDALDVLEEVSRSDGDAGIRAKASSLVTQIQQTRIPVRLRYFVYGCKTLDESLNDKFPERKIFDYSLARSGGGNVQSILDKARKAVGGKLSTLLSSANGSLPFSVSFNLTSQMMNRAGDYMIWINPAALRITRDRISGEVEFTHRQTGEKITHSFEVDGASDRLLVARSGNNISLLMFQFSEERPAGTAGGGFSFNTRAFSSALDKMWRDLSETFGTPDEPEFNAAFNMLGWKIHSARENWTLDDMAGKSGIQDFGRAEAFSDSPEGWKLAGQILLLLKERRFLARKAVLVDPSGKAVAVADEISVPVDDPAKFEVTGSKKADFDTAAASPDYGPLNVSSTLMIHPAIKIHTERSHYDIREFDKNLIDLDSAKAEIYQGRIQSPLEKSGDVNVKLSGLPGGKSVSREPWILVGDLFYFKEQEKLLGFGAYLLNPEREKVAEGLIEVPAGDPAGFNVVSGRVFEKKREVVASRDERRTRTYYSTQWSSHLGWEVLTTRNSMGSSATATGGKTDFGLARALRTYGGRDWILIGQIMTLEGERKFIGRLAALIASDGTVVHGTEIHVPADNPSKYTVK